MTAVDLAEREFLLHATITGGLGLSAIGLDRGEIGPSLLCRADLDGSGVVVTARNTAFGHSGSTTAERAAAQLSFAESALARCPVTVPGSFDPAPLGLVDLVAIGQRLTDAAETPRDGGSVTRRGPRSRRAGRRWRRRRTSTRQTCLTRPRPPPSRKRST